MNKYEVRIVLPEGRVKEVLDKLHDAQETIKDCYDELRWLGVLTTVEKSDSGN